MEVKPGYKQTEVGVIPQEWEVKPLGEIGGVRMCKRVLKHQTQEHGDVPFYKIGTFGGVADAFIAQALFDEFKRKYSFPQKGDVLISAAGTIGRTVIYDGAPAYFQDSNIVWIENDGAKATNAYLWHCYQVTKWSVSHGGTVARLYNDSLRTKILIPVPTLPEQGAIATALSDMDGLLGGLDRLIAKKRDLKQAAMQQLLTGQIRLPGFGPTASFKKYAFGSIPDDWGVKPLKSISTMNGRIGWQGLKQEEFTMNPNDPFLITGMNFKDGKIRWDEVYHILEKRYLEAAPIRLRPNDVLMTKDGTIGKLLYVERIPHPGKASLNSHLLVFRPIAGQYSPKFLFYQLGSPTFAQHVELHKSGTTFFGLSQTATGKYPTILPRVPEQTAIAEVLTEMDAELAALEQRREKTRALKQAMMQELLTGRIRLLPS